MTAVNKKSLMITALLLGLCTSGYSLQKVRPEKAGELADSTIRRTIRSLNGGLPRQAKGPRYAPGQLLIRFKPSVSTQFVNATLAQYDTKEIKRISQLNLYQVRIPDWASVEEMAYALSQNPNVMSAGPNYIVWIAATPNDPLFRYQYALSNSGQDVGAPGSSSGKSKADIKATAGWEETKGAVDTVIAIIDTGIDFEHPDLKNKIISRGHDFVNDDEDATDDHGHGTFVAGIAAADTNNDEGIAGVAWNCKILPVKVINADKWGYLADVIAGIIWATDNGADVINLSLGGPDPDDSLRDAVRYAHEKGVVIAVAAGNYETANDRWAVWYPAAYDAYCLAVAATNNNDERTSWSCFGPEVDVAAPGEWVLSTYPTYMTDLTKYLPYAWGDGTSASAPHVAGLAALLKGLKPWLTVDEIMDVIRFSSDDVNSGEQSGKDDNIGYGRINMEKALVPIKLSK